MNLSDKICLQAAVCFSFIVFLIYCDIDSESCEAGQPLEIAKVTVIKWQGGGEQNSTQTMKSRGEKGHILMLGYFRFSLNTVGRQKWNN